MFNPFPKNIVQTNRFPFVIGMVVFILVLGFFMYKTQQTPKVVVAPSPSKPSIDVSARQMESSWFNDEKFKNVKINPADANQQSPEVLTQKAISKEESELARKQMESDYATRLEINKLEDKARIDAKKWEIEAGQSPLNIEVPALPGVQPSTENKSGKNLKGFDDIINMVKTVALSKAPSLVKMVDQMTDINNQNGKEAFLAKDMGQEDYLKATKKKPRSTHEVKAGSYITAALMTGINSDLPGSVMAQVVENVYDTLTGNDVLIPQGCKLIGEYNSQLTFGQDRVQVVWSRLIFPDGSSLNLERMQGADISGYTGFKDKVDYHYLRLYGNAILLSLMGAGYDSLNKKAQQSSDPRETVAASIGQRLADVSSKSIERHMDVQPTVMINPGYKFKILVMKDMVLEKIDDAQGTLSYTI